MRTPHCGSGREACAGPDARGRKVGIEFLLAWSPGGNPTPRGYQEAPRSPNRLPALRSARLSEWNPIRPSAISRQSPQPRS